MNKTNFVLMFLVIVSILFLTGCDVYKKLYGAEEVSPSQNISAEVEKTLEEILPIEAKEKVEEAKEEIEEAKEEIKEEIAEEKKSELGEEAGKEANVVTVQETELVKLQPQAEDPDKDNLIFTFSSPLNEKGEWQTNYGDAGEYTVTVTVSDGKLTTSQDVLIIVNKKEEKPTISSFAPKETAVKIKETDSVDFNIEASDLNKDKLSYSWKLDGVEVGTDYKYAYKTTYDDSGSHTVKADASDGKEITTQLWSVTVENVNRKPTLEEISPIKLKEAEILTIKPQATDPDGDKINFTISEPVGNDGVWETTYEDAGEYTITVTASDGIESVSQDVKITVENVNRPPLLRGIVQKG